ncbi:sensor histidine kinase [Pacificoceanicola onchidii]|uniref:sensor histidine kinase n=1 Tax=Pacificoceanicola onchidii TaxID=2562685 RepID=UPI0010A37B85|nr:ATP-binding protein [Pacificoceanicola onchidii]
MLHQKENPTPNPAETTREIARLYEVEYGDTPELIVRMLGVGGGTALFYVYSGWMIAWIWPLAFYICHAVFFTFLRSQRSAPGPRAPHLACALFFVVMLSFLWLPAYLAAQPDMELSYIGTILIATLIIFLIRRGDTYIWLIVSEACAILISLLYVLWAKLDRTDDTLAKIALAVVTFVVCGYLLRGLTAARRLRMTTEAAAVKALQEQKLAAIGQLAGGVAHDFNNVLTAISGNLELYDHLHDPDERHHVIGEARTAANRATEVVRQLLIYARKAPTVRSTVDINACVTELSNLSRSLVTEKVRVKLDMPPAPMHVHVDEGQLLTAMLNIVVNAVDAMPSGGSLTISVAISNLRSARPMADGTDLRKGLYLRLDFRDTGSGISDAVLGRVIEPFFTTKPPGKGTGLGLSMVQGFARESGGGLAIATGPTGTMISLYLPQVDPPAAPK